MEEKGIKYSALLQLVFCLLLKCGSVDGQNGGQPGSTGNGGGQVCNPLLQYLFGTCVQWPFPTSTLPISSIPSPPPPRRLIPRPRFRHVVPTPLYTVPPPGSPPSPHVPSSPQPPYVPLPPSRPLLPYLSPPLSRSPMRSPPPPPPPYVPLPPLPPMPFLSNIPPSPLPTASPPPPPYVTLPPLPAASLRVSKKFPYEPAPPFPDPASATVQAPSPCS